MILDTRFSWDNGCGKPNEIKYMRATDVGSFTGKDVGVLCLIKCMMRRFWFVPVFIMTE